jgi:hypothetical protein
VGRPQISSCTGCIISLFAMGQMEREGGNRT